MQEWLVLHSGSFSLSEVYGMQQWLVAGRHLYQTATLINVQECQQRNYLVAKRKYNLTEESVVDDIVKNVGIEKSDFPAIYYCALDCALMASITHDDNWQLLLIEALLAYLQLNRFQYHLSGVYLWETKHRQFPFL